jgi:PAS domain-containing protein
VILVPRRSLLLFLLLALAGAATLGVRGYLLIGTGEPGLRVRAEELLFLALVFCLALVALFLSLFLRNRHVLRELDKIVDLARHGSFSFEESLRRLGALGERVRAINLRLGELNEMKTLRISALSGINAFLVNNAQLPLVITDITGKVSDLSPPAAEKLAAEKDAIRGRNLAELLPELDFQDIVSRLEKEHTELKMARGKETNAFYPILNRDNQLSNVVCVLGKAEVISETGRRREEAARKAGRLRGLLRRYLGSRR